MSEIDEALAAWGAHDRDDPFPIYAELRARGPVHAVTLADGHDAWLVVGYDEAKSALNESRFSKDMQAALAADSEVVAEGLPGPDFARHMLVVDAPDHTRLRRLVAAAFSVRRVESLRPRVQAVINDLLDDIAAEPSDTTVDLVRAFAFPLPFTVICELLGVPMGDRDAFGVSLKGLLPPTATPEEFARAKAASDTFVDLLTALVAAKRSAPADDLISALIEARDGNEQLTQQELLSTLLQLIVAGHDTTTSLIGNSVVALLKHPDELHTWLTQPEEVANAVEEFMRFDAPVPHSTFRYATEPVELGGVTIPAGEQVIVSLAAANRDKEHYDAPERLDVQRADVRHLAFGHGIHFCLGAALARMEGQLALGSLFARFPHLRLAVPVGDLHWGHGDGLVLRGLSELPVVPGAPASN